LIASLGVVFHLDNSVRALQDVLGIDPSVISPLPYQFVWERDSPVLHASLYLPLAVMPSIESAIGPSRPGMELFNDRRTAAIYCARLTCADRCGLARVFSILLLISSQTATLALRGGARERPENGHGWR
jgi:hypothetical protein